MQGFNMGRYVPPDLEGTTSGNKLHGKHALGARANKLGQGILTVRFEMPYPIWCLSCLKPTIIGQGVRFNAEKKKVGAYHTTSIWQFRIKHADCGGAIEMRTDPKNTAYVVVSGARKRDTGEDDPDKGREVRAGEFVILTDQEREKLRSNAFASLEKTIEDRQQLVQATERLDELEDASSRHWDDPYRRNQMLRRTFRAGRKEREKAGLATEDLKDRMSLGIDLVPAREEDARRAALVDFRPAGEEGHADKALAKPLFASAAKPPTKEISTGKKLKAEALASKRRDDLATVVVTNTRMAQDPFLTDVRGSEGQARIPVRLPGIKRKRAAVEEVASESKSNVAAAPSIGLVSYDSD